MAKLAFLLIVISSVGATGLHVATSSIPLAEEIRKSESSRAIDTMTDFSSTELAQHAMERQRAAAPPDAPSSVISEATTGKIFKMAKIREYTSARPNFEAHTTLLDTESAALKDKSDRCSSKKWAVVTTIFGVTEGILKMDKLEGWCTVVVSDKKSLSEHDYCPDCQQLVYLTPDDQMELNIASVKGTPWNHFSRKNIGYLYAMKRGAETILDFDDDNSPNFNAGMPDTLAPFASDLKGNLTEAFIFAGTPGAVNIYEHAGRPDVWPRGFPLPDIKDRKMPISSIAVPASLNLAVRNTRVDPTTVAVRQSLAQADPDVDAIYRLTRPLPVEFSADATPLVLPKGFFAPFNGQATTWNKEAFALMRLPSTVHGRVSDIWRSYIAQPLLWNQNLTVAFTGPRFEVPERNAHSYLGDFNAEAPLYQRSGALIEWLGARASGSSMTGQTSRDLFETYVDLYEHGMIEEDDVTGMKTWIEDLQRFGIL